MGPDLVYSGVRGTLPSVQGISFTETFEKKLEF